MPSQRLDAVISICFDNAQAGAAAPQPRHTLFVSVKDDEKAFKYLHSECKNY